MSSHTGAGAQYLHPEFLATLLNIADEHAGDDRAVIILAMEVANRYYSVSRAGVLRSLPMVEHPFHVPKDLSQAQYSLRAMLLEGYDVEPRIIKIAKGMIDAGFRVISQPRTAPKPRYGQSTTSKI